MNRAYQTIDAVEAPRPLRRADPLREPLEAIEGKACKATVALAVDYRATSTEREAHDRQHDDMADLCERSILAGDGMTALRAIRALKAHDAAKDAVARQGDGHADMACGYTRQIPGLVEALCAGRSRTARAGRGSGEGGQ